MGEKSKYALGSVTAYYKEFDGTVPAYSDMAVDGNILTRVKNGASVEYTADSFDDSDDLGYVKVNNVTKEDIKLKLGAMTFNGETLSILSQTGRTTVENGIRKTKIGGLSNQSNKKYCVLCVHKDDTLGDIRLWIVGKNTSGFTLTFAQDAITVLDIEFAASAIDDDGTLLIYEEIVPLTITGISSTAFDKKTANQDDITATVNEGITSIKNGSNALTVTTHYTVGDDDTLTIKKEYLATLNVGTVTLDVEGENGFKKSISIVVSDTTAG